MEIKYGTAWVYPTPGPTGENCVLLTIENDKACADVVLNLAEALNLYRELGELLG